MIQDVAGWIAPATTMIAAVMTAANLGPRVTGWGFVVFTLSAVAWIVVAATSGQQNLLFSNLFLLVVDGIGVWRWLGREARYDAGASAATADSRSGAVPTIIAMGALGGKPVQDEAGSTIATVVETMVACEDGAIRYIVVREGGIAGVGERLHALGWDEVRVGADAVVARVDRDRLAARPALDPKHWPESAEAAGVG